jgi:abortive infection bacteriophage resistance protein
MIKVVNFSTFIDVLHNSKANVTHAICKLYSMYDNNNLPNVKLLIGSLHWLRRVRNSCAHNERVYCIHQTQARNNSASGRILDPYYAQLPASYRRCTEKNIFDTLIYFKYFLPKEEFAPMIMELKSMLIELQNTLQPNAFDNVRGQMGIKNLDVLDTLITLPKSKIEYHKFDTL